MSWTLEGNIKGTPGTPTDEIDGITPLTIGQDYVDVVFPTAQPSKSWVGIEHRVVNTTDGAPSNILTGNVTLRLKTGYRLQLIGTPDTPNFALTWTIRPAPPITGGADTYEFTGPASGKIGTPATFIVRLPAGTTLSGETLTIIPASLDGVFAPASVQLTDDAPMASFAYTPSTYGDRLIEVSNDLGLTDPSSLAFKSTAATYSFSGPGTGDVGVASAPFTIQLPVGSVLDEEPTIFVPHESGVPESPLDTFLPQTLAFISGDPAKTFIYTPHEVGVKDIYITNSSNLTDPAAVAYNATAPTAHLLDRLIDYYKLDDAAGVNPLVDSHGTNPLTFSAGGSNPFAGIINNAQYLPGGAGYNAPSHASNAALQVTGDFFWSIWCRVDAQVDGAIFLKDDFVSARDYALVYNGAAGTGFGAVVAGTIQAFSGANVATLGWHHIVFWYDASDQKVRLRLDDAATFVSATSGALVQSAAPFSLGRAGGYCFNGLVDEMGFWKRKPTALDITTLYNGGAGKPYSLFLP